MLPDAKVTIAHGQMSPKDLKETMIKFHNKEIDILHLDCDLYQSYLDVLNNLYKNVKQSGSIRTSRRSTSTRC